MRRPAWAKFSPIHHGALKRYAPQWFGLHTHATASQVRDVVGRKIFDSYYKFTVERNPWDRQVSLYSHRQWKKGKPADNFDRDMQSFIYRNTSYVRLDNWSKYAIGNEIVADRVIRYERLAEENEELVAMLGISGPIELPRLRQYAGERPHYSTYYSDPTRNLVGRWYAKEIEALGHTFESAESAAQARAAALAEVTPADNTMKVVVSQNIPAAQSMAQKEPAIVYGARTASGIPASKRRMAG
jgi:hypothetical protein